MNFDINNFKWTREPESYELANDNAPVLQMEIDEE